METTIAGELYTMQSSKSVRETISRIEKELISRNIPVFAVYDHSANATNIGLKLRPTQVIVFGDPKAGTKLMQQNQNIGLELPLKIVVWENQSGEVMAAFEPPSSMATKYDMENHPIIINMQMLLENILIKACSNY